MWFMILLSWIAVFLQISFVTLSLAAGLYYLAELVEEYTVATARFIKYTIFITLGAYFLLAIFEDFPWLMILVGVAAQLSYLFVLQSFPFFDFLSPSFIIGAVLCIYNHYLTFQHFSVIYYSTFEITGYFTIFLWLVPFEFFISLTANDSTLPTTVNNVSQRTSQETSPLMKSDDEGSDLISNIFRRRSRKYGLLSFLKSAQETILPQRIKKAY